MAEPFINDTTPKSSPILAYGESSPSLIGRFGILLGGITAALIITTIIFVVAARKIPFPASPSVVIGLAASTPLPASAPELWRAAQERARPFPIIVGFAGANHQTPFVIAPRYALSNAVTQTAVWGLEGENLGIDATTTAFTSVSPTIFTWPWVRIWPMRLFPIAETAASDESVSVAGPVSGSSWRTDLPVQNSRAPHAIVPEGQGGVDFTAVPEAWPFIANMFRGDGVPMDQRLAPDAVRWARTSDGELAIALTFFNGIPSETLTQAQNILGKTDLKLFTLADGDIVNELITSSTASSTSEAAFSYTTDTIFVGEASATSVPWTGSLVCPGQVVSFFTIPQTSSTTDLTFADLFQATRLVLTNDRGHIRVCWE